MKYSYYLINSNKYYATNITENFNNNLYEHIVAGDFSTTYDASIGDQKAQSEMEINQTNQTTSESTQTIDNSVISTNTTSSNTNINSSQNIMQTNTTDQRSNMTINSSTDTYNYDQSSILNATTTNTQNKLVQSCGTTIEEAQSIINITKDESTNTNINNGNVFINTGDNVVISDIRLESDLTFLGSSVDKSCVLDAMNDLQTEIEADNINSKSFTGGEGGDIGAEAGGNTTTSENDNSKADSLDAGMSTENSTTQAAKTTADLTNTQETTSEASAEQSQEQSQTGAGGISDSITLFIIVFIVIYYLIL